MCNKSFIFFKLVAPLAGAWIETITNFGKESVCLSLPLRERGLKQTVKIKQLETMIVAPLAGAWIETEPDFEIFSIIDTSLPLRERGLKPVLLLTRPL